MRFLSFSIGIVLLGVLAVSGASASVQDEIEKRTKLIEELQRQIEQYQNQAQEAGSKVKTLASEVSRLNARIQQAQLEIRTLSLAIDQTNSQIQVTQGQILSAQEKLDLHRAALGRYLRLMAQTDEDSLTELIFRNARLSDFFDTLRNLEDTQHNVQLTMEDIRQLKTDLEQKEEALEGKRSELQTLQALEKQEKRNLDLEKGTKDKLLKDTKGQEAKYQQLITQSKKDIQAIQDQIFYLRQNGVSTEDAIKYAQLAAVSAGIRPAFLLGILEVESGLGKNVGTGNWMDDMYKCYLRLGKPQRAEAEKKAFLEITAKLGLDPNSVKVSREPNYGCGGAMGPAQFIATTWLGYESEVGRLTGHRPPSPWNVEDAFTASALKLSRGGASLKTIEGETRAAKAYISGNPNCSTTTCKSYARAVLNKAAIIEKNL